MKTASSRPRRRRRRTSTTISRCPSPASDSGLIRRRASSCCNAGTAFEPYQPHVEWNAVLPSISLGCTRESSSQGYMWVRLHEACTQEVEAACRPPGVRLLDQNKSRLTCEDLWEGST